MQTSSSDAYQQEYPSAAYLNADTLFVSDGHGLLFILGISAHGQGELRRTYQLPKDAFPTESPFRIHSSSQTSEDTTLVILSMKHHETTNDDVHDQPSAHKRSHARFDVLAAAFNLPSLVSPSDGVLALDIVWHRRGEDVPLYTAYHANLKTFLLVGGSPYQRIDTAPQNPYEPSPDEMAPIPRQGENLDGSETPNIQKPPPYAWTQDSEELTVAFPLPTTTPKSAFNILFSPQTLTVLVRAESMDLTPLPRFSAARLWGGISPTSSFWTWDAQGTSVYGLLTLHLEKQHAGTRWPHVFDTAAAAQGAGAGATGDTADVPETLDPSELYAIRESLEKYTAGLREGRDVSGLGLGSGVPSLAEGELDDEADAAVGFPACLTWVNADGSAPPWARESEGEVVNILSTPLPGIQAVGISLAVKSTVDGLLYSLSEGEDGGAPGWKHTSTLSALAFVLASKRDTRFIHHISSKAVLAFEGGSSDYSGNLYIYRVNRPKDTWAKQAILHIGGGAAGPLLGVGAIERSPGHPLILCLCESEMIVLRATL